MDDKQKTKAQLLTEIDNLKHVVLKLKEAESKHEVVEKLEESENISKLIIESMQDGILILDENGVHLVVNPAFCKMTGLAKEELIGVGPPHPYWPEEEYENIERAFEKTSQGIFKSSELVFKNKCGKRFPVLVNHAQVPDDQGNVVSK